ncbi:hypothetical protein DR864_13940 [Runella rosea]|uniref:Lipoprotein n=1 Tax=Runella rosea TaxID=2259595 RepID=A0A344TJF1_9BACT|nr:hypothetical protein DR864_13940 [Runella rosea]
MGAVIKKNKQNIVKYLLFITLTFVSCNSYNEREIQLNAKSIVENLDESILTKFCDWSVTPRGNEIWHFKDFSIFYNPNLKDSIWFRVLQIHKFEKDFPISISFKTDTSEWSNYDFIQTKSEYLISKTNSNAEKLKIATDSLFTLRNPFEEIKSLSTIKNKYGIIMIDNHCEMNNIVFYLTPKHILIYYQKGHLLKETTGIHIFNNNWVLKKLEKPIDFS